MANVNRGGEAAAKQRRRDRANSIGGQRGSGIEPIPRGLLKDLTPLAETVPPGLTGLLDDAEISSLQRRVQRLLRDKALPVDHTGMRYPWPLV